MLCWGPKRIQWVENNEQPPQGGEFVQHVANLRGAGESSRDHVTSWPFHFTMAQMCKQSMQLQIWYAVHCYNYIWIKQIQKTYFDFDISKCFIFKVKASGYECTHTLSTMFITFPVEEEKELEISNVSRSCSLPCARQSTKESRQNQIARILLISWQITYQHDSSWLKKWKRGFCSWKFISIKWVD